MLTKEEMEKIWNTGYVGQLAEYCKNTKSKKQFTVIAKPFVKQMLDHVETTVWAKSGKAAGENWEAQQKLSKAVREKYPSDQYPNLSWTYAVKNQG